METKEKSDILLEMMLPEVQQTYLFKGRYGEDIYKNSDGTKGIHSREKNKLISECEEVFGFSPTLGTLQEALIKANLSDEKAELASRIFLMIWEALEEEHEKQSEMESSLYELLEHYHGNPEHLLLLGVLAKLIKPKKLPEIKQVPPESEEIEALTYRTYRRVEGSSKPR